ncbi:MAG: YkgJ family cysteine cluster protein [Pseudomonadota bacterium]
MRVPNTKVWLKTEFAQRPDLLANGMVVADKVIARLNTAWNQSKSVSPDFSDRYRELLRVADDEIGEMTARAGDIPCRLGCNYCCKDERITLTEKEAVLAVKHMEAQLDAEQKARIVASILASTPTSDRASVPCAFLVDERCAIYADRPLACRSYFSRSVSSCHEFFLDKSKTPQRFSAPKMVEIAVREVTRAAKYSKFYEINTLMQRIYADPDKPAQWLSGRMSDESDLADPE